MGEEGDGKSDGAQFVDHQNGSKSAYGSRKRGAPGCFTEAQRETGRGQPQKSHHTSGVNTAQRRGESGVVTRASCRFDGRVHEFLLCAARSAWDRMNHSSVWRPKNPKTPASRRFMNTADACKAG